MIKPLFDLKDVNRFLSVLERVEFSNFAFHVKHDGSEANGKPRYVMHITCNEGTCNHTGKPLSWNSRKWLLSVHMTDGEIVQTAFKAVLVALEHEAREQFKYRGVTVFDPHYDIDKLVELRSRPDSIKERDYVA